MLIYARNQTFCSKSVNKAPKILIFGLNMWLCGMSLAIILEKNVGIKINFLCILLFYEFLMYYFVYVTFNVFVCFFRWAFVADNFLKHNNAKTNSFQPLRVKISIFIWTMCKNSICIGFVHINDVSFWSHFRSRQVALYKKLRNFRTVPPGVTNLVLKCAGNLKVKKS